MTTTNRPDWVPADAGAEFATHVRPGSLPAQPGASKAPKNRLLTVEDYVQGVLRGDRSLLSRTITLVESNAPAHQALARQILQQLLPHTGKSIRVGITGFPGAGKSTLIENLGIHLLEQGYRLAVLAIDPSSTLTGGSILGDKTRMEQLTRDPRCFIRPSPSGGALGGVTRKSRETLLVCEAAGYDVVLVETVGVGQSEVTVRSMVDCFLLVLIAGAGDELQGIKKGVMELADALLVNKADGDNLTRAKAARSEYALALKYLSPATPGWKPPALITSALTGSGVPELWQRIREFVAQTQASGYFEQRRQHQQQAWFKSLLESELLQWFYAQPQIKQQLPQLQQALQSGQILVPQAVEQILAQGLEPNVTQPTET